MRRRLRAYWNGTTADALMLFEEEEHPRGLGGKWRAKGGTSAALLKKVLAAGLKADPIGRDNVLVTPARGGDERILISHRQAAQYRKGNTEKGELPWVQMRRLSAVEAEKWLELGRPGKKVPEEVKLGPGYSQSAKLKNGVIHTDNVYDAVLALTQDRPVELKQPKQISTLIKALGEVTKSMVEGGETAPSFDLCKVTVKGTNLFCADHKGIPRIQMPQMDDDQTKDFIKHLGLLGFESEKDTEKSANLRATQAQLDTAKVNKFFERIKKDKDFEGDDKRLVVSNDDYVLDGHHHWAAQIAADAIDNKLGDHKTRIWRVDTDIITLYKLAMKFTGGKGGKGMGDALGLGFIDKVINWEEDKHQRVPKGEGGGGRFGTTGVPLVWKNARAIAALMGGSEGKSEKPKLQLDPDAVNVGGDEWNKETAIRLETEYQNAKPKLEQLLVDYERGVDNEGKGYVEPDEDEDEDEEYDGPPAPEEWDMLSEDSQNEIEEAYYEKTLDDYVESEVQSWRDSGGALDEAKSTLTNSSDFVFNTLKEYIEGKTEEGEPLTETNFPYYYLDIADAITMEYDSDGEGTGKVSVSFDDDKLMDPNNAPPKEQLGLPNIEPEDLSQRLTKEMRIEIIDMLKEKFEEKAKEMEDDIEPPDFTDQAKEYMQENWSSMDDGDKFAFAKWKTDVIDDLEKQYEEAQTLQTSDAPVGLLGIPETYDPLNKTSGDDYRKTQSLARRMSLDRAVQVFEERGIKMGAGVETRTALRRLDSELWSAWKSSSTSTEGQLLQVAVADELGGRLNPNTGSGGRVKLDKEAIAEQADNDYASTGGYEGILAYVRAKWETTQLLLDKADMDELELYRGIGLDEDKYAEAEASAVKEGGYIKAPMLKVVRNGAASTTFNPDVANGWSSSDNRVVLRALMPRTAAISIPAYGINVKSEQEVVVAGTAWKRWDAWLRKAPRFSDVKMAA
jgi:hypothetical protein